MLLLFAALKSNLPANLLPLAGDWAPVAVKENAPLADWLMKQKQLTQ